MRTLQIFLKEFNPLQVVILSFLLAVSAVGIVALLLQLVFNIEIFVNAKFNF